MKTNLMREDQLATALTVGELERRLLELYPREDAETWDRTGLVVGDPNEPVASVAIALDPTYAALCACREFGANVLITHHPLFIDPPQSFVAFGSGGDAAGARVHAAARWNVSCLSFHTTLDVSADGARMLPWILDLDFDRIVVPAARDGRLGYGQLCSVRDDDLDLRGLALRCKRVFGRTPRVWGDAGAPVERVVCATGSAGNVIEGALSQGADCLVCGEVRYHDALDAQERRLALVELGHDVSELPFCAVLAKAVASVGVDAESIHIYDQSSNWFTV